MRNTYRNHIIFNIDGSGSMQGREDSVVKLFNNQVAFLAKRSQELDQETRVSVYIFNRDVQCLVFDTDVLRTPNINDLYKPSGQTALIDATLKAIEDAEKIPQLYHDSSFLIYVISDGENNIHDYSAPKLSQRIKNLPENWTLGMLAPDQTAVYEAKKFGFPAENISIWDTSSHQGVEGISQTIQQSTETFLVNRSKGIRGTKNLFQVDVNFSSKEVKTKLTELKPDQYNIFPVHAKSVIKPFVESWTKETYRPGSAYYMLTKPEKIQNYKQICVQDKRNGKVYTGTNARNLLGLPDYEIKVEPGDFKDFNIFAQSTSLNRNLMPGTQLIVLK